MKRFAVLAAALAVGGCGGAAEIGGETPEGFAQTERFGAAFAHPKGWRPEEETAANGTQKIVVSKPLAAYAALSRYNDEPRELDETARSYKLGVENIGRGKTVEEKEVDVPGAEGARRFVFEQPASGGGTLRRESLVVVVDARRVYTFDVAAREGEDVDLTAILESFRVEGR